MRTVIMAVKNGKAAAAYEDGSLGYIKDEGYVVGQILEIPKQKGEIASFPGKVRGPAQLKASGLVAALCLATLTGGIMAYSAPVDTYVSEEDQNIEYSVNVFNRVVGVTFKDVDDEAATGTVLREVSGKSPEEAEAITKSILKERAVKTDTKSDTTHDENEAMPDDNMNIRPEGRPQEKDPSDDSKLKDEEPGQNQAPSSEQQPEQNQTSPSEQQPRQDQTPPSDQEPGQGQTPPAEQPGQGQTPPSEQPGQGQTPPSEQPGQGQTPPSEQEPGQGQTPPSDQQPPAEQPGQPPSDIPQQPGGGQQPKEPSQPQPPDNNSPGHQTPQRPESDISI